MTATLTTELRTIRVYGTLADLIGRRTFQAVVKTVRDAVNFLIANFPQVEAHIKQRYFRVKVSNWTLGEDDLSAPVGVTDEIHIIPAICGAGGDDAPLIGVLAGVALIGVGLFVPGAGPIFTNLGIGLLLTGISALISPTPQVPDEENDPSKSYNFSGVQNTSNEGVPIPCVYGEIVTGSILISLGTFQDEEEFGLVFTGGSGDPIPEPNPFPTEGLQQACSQYWDFEGYYCPLIDTGTATLGGQCCTGTASSGPCVFNTWYINFGTEVCFTGFLVEGNPKLSQLVLDAQGACCEELFCREDTNITYLEKFGFELYRDVSFASPIVDASTVLWQSDSGPGYQNGKRSVVHALFTVGGQSLIVRLANGTSGSIRCIENEWTQLKAIALDSQGNPI